MIKNYPINFKEIERSFNSDFNIKYVIETATGVNFKGLSFCCPTHISTEGKRKATVSLKDNVATCWSRECYKGAKPWQFIRTHFNITSTGVDGYNETVEKINSIFGTSYPTYRKAEPKAKTKEAFKVVNEYDEVYKVDNYMSEQAQALLEKIKEKDRILLNANTGLGKTYGIFEMFKGNPFGTDVMYVFAPVRSLAEQTAHSKENVQLFYGNDGGAPLTGVVASTFHKAPIILNSIEKEMERRAKDGIFDFMYIVVIDEVHELLSKENLLGDKAEALEKLIDGAHKVILMSANTEHIAKAYKDTGLYTEHICVERKAKINNAKKFRIIKTNGKIETKYSTDIKLILEAIKNGNKVMYCMDNIDYITRLHNAKELQQYSRTLINSKNKEDEEVTEAYNEIIKNDKLLNQITFVTSVINAGVNIKDTGVTMMIRQDRNAFDTEKVGQFLARVRTEGNDLIFLKTNCELDKIPTEVTEFEVFLEREKRGTQIIIENLKIYLMDIYAETGEDKTIEYWASYSSNELNARYSKNIKLKDGLLIANKRAIYNNARLKWERNNYHNDEFLLEKFKDVKAETIEIIHLEPNTNIKEEKEVVKEEIPFNERLVQVTSNIKNITDLYQVMTKQVKVDDLNNEEIQLFYKEENQSKLYKEFSRHIKNIIMPYMDNDKINKHLIFIELLNLYKEGYKKALRDIEAKNIKRVRAYNIECPLNCSKSKIRATADPIYIAVREYFELYADCHHPASNNTYNMALERVAKLRQYKQLKEDKDKNTFTDVDGKKVKVEKVENEILNCLKAVYNITEKGYIYGLITE